jgi:tRNA (guanine37-N1)-methyltransferase
MRIEVLTIFPEMVRSVLESSIMQKAQERGCLEVNVINIRDYTEDKHRTVDDYPYGGGSGMLLKAGPIFSAVDELKKKGELRILMTTPKGRVFNQDMALDLSLEDKRIVFVCGHYEGIDERVRILLKPEEVSIGDYVLTGGELAALVVIDASVRLIPGALGNDRSSADDSFSGQVNAGLLEYPHYTRPAEFCKLKVPRMLLSGNHKKIAAWRRKRTLFNTLVKRPDLLENLDLTEEEAGFISDLKTRKFGCKKRSYANGCS